MPALTHTVAARCCRALAAVALALLAAAAPAAAQSGGASFTRTGVTELKCGTGERTRCPRGAVLRVSGTGLRATRTVIFLGGPGRKDDRRARPTEASPRRVLVKVPSTARSGRVRVVTRHATAATGPRLQVLSGGTAAKPKQVVPTATAADGGVFPVRGAYDFGTHVNTFGGGRGHEGHDVFAKCGTPVVAALPGKVTLTKWHDRAGHYAVVKATDGTSQAYMHLREAPSVRKGDDVLAGTPLGRVGDTGRASGCHLHFELWTAPGWYEGGKPIDPLPYLKRWAGAAS
jgi:murein DD-endopeptidase MepM/ murein hydrolase activator NlpD